MGCIILNDVKSEFPFNLVPTERKVYQIIVPNYYQLRGSTEVMLGNADPGKCNNVL
jgi:hypothetical protein